MKHDEKLAAMKKGLQAMLAKIEEAEKGEMPKNFDIKKLEDAYDEISKEYVMVLKKKHQ